jgi:hypothetical protein
MNGDTLILNANYNDAHGPKHVESGRTKAMERTIITLPRMEPMPEKSSREAMGKRPRATEIGERIYGNGEANRITAPPSSRRRKISHPFSTELAQVDTGASQVSSTLADGGRWTLTAPEVDFSSAPSDPIQLAWWVAQQISHFQESGSNDQEPDADDEGDGSPYRTAALHTQLSNSHLSPHRATRQEKVKEDNRERKKRWREVNTERSMYDSVLILKLRT